MTLFDLSVCQPLASGVSETWTSMRCLVSDQGCMAIGKPSILRPYALQQQHWSVWCIWPRGTRKREGFAPGHVKRVEHPGCPASSDEWGGAADAIFGLEQ